MIKDLNLEWVIETPEVDQDLSFEENIKNVLDNTKFYLYNRERDVEDIPDKLI